MPLLPQDTPLPILEIEHDRIANEVAHLKRSNGELAEAVKEEGPDPEYTLAIEENVGVIAKKERELEELQQMINEAKSRVHIPLEAAMEDAQVEGVTPAPTATNTTQEPSGSTESEGAW
eukprot:CAMPEP_0118921860 /NCGR_PEP_ID=MMETSP1169-20130426/1002_1 /TAXON_ID=36882 /ORGANISM="Pyramimonas obovata, Strain CCMP722" /LENGTH=118 /DNA_ID=CAMNT_0006862651 /DNA_START=104 /DNA_END=457 /DNA_ORIENTATION=+